MRINQDLKELHFISFKGKVCFFQVLLSQLEEIVVLLFLSLNPQSIYCFSLLVVEEQFIVTKRGSKHQISINIQLM